MADISSVPHFTFQAIVSSAVLLSSAVDVIHFLPHTPLQLGPRKVIQNGGTKRAGEKLPVGELGQITIPTIKTFVH